MTTKTTATEADATARGVKQPRPRAVLHDPGMFNVSGAAAFIVGLIEECPAEGRSMLMAEVQRLLAGDKETHGNQN